jgi:hypothetical protein
MSSRGREQVPSGGLDGVVVGLEGVEHDAGEASFEAAQRFGGGHSLGLLLLVVGLAEAVHTDLGDGDAVDRGVELSVAGAGEADASGGVAGPDRDRGDAGVAGERGLGFAPADARGLADELAAVRAPTPGMLSSDGAALAVRSAMRRSKASIQTVSSMMSRSSSRASSATRPAKPSSLSMSRFCCLTRRSDRAGGAAAGSSSWTRHNSRLVVEVRCCTRSSRRSMSSFNSRDV